MFKSVAISVMMLLFVQVATAQIKVVEKSSKEVPSWLGGAMQDYVIVSAEDATLDGAKARCLSDIKQSIINSVATYVKSEETSLDFNIQENQETRAARIYSSQVESIAARMPFITGISFNDSEVFWKKLYNKKDRSYKYEVHVKYPFSRVERDKLIDSFLEYDRAQQEKFDSIKDKYSKFTEVEYIGVAINDLKALKSYFVDDMRSAEVTALMDNFQKLYKSISIVPYSSSLGEIVYYLTLGDRRITSSRKPTISSVFATEIVHTPIEDNMYKITYVSDYSLPEDEKKIDVVHKFASGSAKHSFYFDIDGGIEIIPFGQIELRCFGPIGTEDMRVGIALDVRSKSSKQFSIEILEISSGDNLMLRGTPELSFSGKGEHRINIEATGILSAENLKSALAYGSMKVLDIATGKSKEIRFTLPYKIIKK